MKIISQKIFVHKLMKIVHQLLKLEFDMHTRRAPCKYMCVLKAKLNWIEIKC
jgi:hypothetical protein